MRSSIIYTKNKLLTTQESIKSLKLNVEYFPDQKHSCIKF